MLAVNRRISFFLGLLFLGVVARSSAQSTAFSYQGQLNDGGAPANGSYDLRFAVYNAVTNGTRISAWLTNSAVSVSNGLFTTTLDFGAGIFTGPNYWLDIAVKATNVTSFTALAPRQPILPVPYAIFANSASNVLGPLSAAQLTGTVGSSQIAGTYANTVNFSSSGSTFAGTFIGNGSSLSNLNGSQITSGTVADARLSSNVALLDHSQTFTGNNQFNGANSFTNWNNSFTGSFFGNGLVGWTNISADTVQAERDHGYMLTSANVTVVTLPSSGALVPGDIVRISGAGTGGWRVAQNAGQSIYGNFLTAINSDWQLASGGGTGLSGIASSADGLKMVAVAGNGGIFTSVNSGRTWNNLYGTLMTCVASSSDGIKLAAGNSGGSGSSIILSTNSGNNWFSPATPVANCWALAMSSDGTHLVAVVNGGRIYTSANSGVNWSLNTTSPNNGNKGWYSVTMSSDGSRCAAVVYGGQIYTSSNYGSTWAIQGGSPTKNWTSIATSSDGSRLTATVYGGNIYTSPDYGVTWTALTNAPSANWTSIDSSADGSRMIAVAYGGGIYLSANVGNTWQQQSPGTQNWTGVACSADCTKMAAIYATLANSGGAYWGQAYFQPTAATTTTGSAGSIGGSQGSAVELQYIGNNQFMPVSSTGTLWAN